jgi:penicillin amidase
MTRYLRALLAALPLAALVYVGARPVGALPALGPLLDPAHGAWAVARSAELPASAEASVAGLGANVRVVYDDRAVPHIFAESEDDAYRALGYVVARDRLFQLELQTRAASGRLTEVAGARALPLDRESRALGMPRAAERKLATVDASSSAGRALAAYAAGVNAYIDGMRDAELPLEFRLLRARPSRWEPINSLHLMNRMGYTLAYIAPELDRAAAADAWARWPPPRSSRRTRRSRSPSSRTASRRRASSSPRSPRPACRTTRRSSPRPPSAASSPRRSRVTPGVPPGRTTTSAGWRATTGRWRRAARWRATRCSPAIRTWSSRCRPSGTRRTSSCPGSSTCTA